MKAVKYRKSIGIILTIACGFTSLTNTGCDDFLSEKEVPRITSDFYKTEQGILAAVDATYAYMRFGVGGEFSNVLTELGTDLITGAEGALSYPYNLYSATLSPTESKLYSLWENHYKGISDANIAMDQILQSDMSESKKLTSLGEMLFIRSFLYFELVQQFGKVPLVTEGSFEIRTDFKTCCNSGYI